MTTDFCERKKNRNNIRKSSKKNEPWDFSEKFYNKFKRAKYAQMILSWWYYPLMPSKCKERFSSIFKVTGLNIWRICLIQPIFDSIGQSMLVILYDS